MADKKNYIARHPVVVVKSAVVEDFRAMDQEKNPVGHLILQSAAKIS